MMMGMMGAQVGGDVRRWLVLVLLPKFVFAQGLVFVAPVLGVLGGLQQRLAECGGRPPTIINIHADKTHKE